MQHRGFGRSSEVRIKSDPREADMYYEQCVLPCKNASQCTPYGVADHGTTA